MECMRKDAEEQYVICYICDITPMTISADAVRGICWRCTQARCGPPEALLKKKPKVKRQRGWHFLAEYVDSEGNVYHKGVEQKELKGTLPPTPEPEPKKKTFKDKKKEEELELDKLLKHHKRKQEALKVNKEKKL